MDFFQNQETARRKTGLLIVYFAVAVASIVLLSNAIVAVALLLTGPREGAQLHSWHDLWNPGLFAAVSLGTLALIGGGSLYRVASLAGGGHSVAEMMGGRPLTPQTTDPDERKILNVVEEMAIASGTPVPPVYLLEGEDGINAFAAGYTPGDAVIGVTPRLHPESHARRAPGGDRPRVQPHPQRRHATQRPIDRRALRHPRAQHDRLDHLPFDRLWELVQ